MFFDVLIGVISLAVGQNSKQLPVPMEREKIFSIIFLNFVHI
jgi:hypothetical protein